MIVQNSFMNNLLLFGFTIINLTDTRSSAFQQHPTTNAIPASNSRIKVQTLYSHTRNENNIIFSEDLKSLSRRDVLKTIITTSTLVSSSTVSNNAIAESSLDLPNGLLESRVLENVLSPPPYEMESSDIFYPSYFNGVWDVQSTTKDIIAPCGITLFGGNYTYNKAQEEVGTTLTYKSRFIPTTNNAIDDNNNMSSSKSIIADREFNVVEIAKSAMGNNAVLDVPLASPNKVSVILSPNKANQIFQADLITLNRRSENISSCEFHCSEVVRQIIAPAKMSDNNNNGLISQQPMAPSRSSLLLKEIETTSLYIAVRDNENDDSSVKQILCKQRSATFLLPSQQDPLALKMWEISRGRPIDVRFYDIVYTKRT